MIFRGFVKNIRIKQKNVAAIRNSSIFCQSLKNKNIDLWKFDDFESITNASIIFLVIYSRNFLKNVKTGYYKKKYSQTSAQILVEIFQVFFTKIYLAIKYFKVKNKPRNSNGSKTLLYQPYFRRREWHYQKILRLFENFSRMLRTFGKIFTPNN